MGNCIGQRNHKYFVSFLFWVSMHCIFTLTVCIVVLSKQQTSSLVTSVKFNIPALILSIVASTNALVLLPFSLYHFLLAFQGKTTNEHIRGKYRKYKGNPFDKGIRRNCGEFWNKKKSKILHKNAS